MVDVATSPRREPPRRVRRPRGDEASPVAPAPHDLDLEESLLGAMLLDEACRAAAFELVTAADFYRPAHGVVFGAISSLVSRGAPVDVVTVADELDRTGLIKELGDPTILVAWQANTASIANGRYYAQRVADYAADRRLLNATVELVHAVRTGDPDARARAFEAITASGSDSARIGHQLVREEIGALMRNPSPQLEPELLVRTDGKCLLMRGMVTIVHGEPSAGKSWLAAEAVRQVTAAGECAAILDYEGNGTTLARRMLALGATPTDVDLLLYVRPGLVPHHVLVAEAMKNDPALVVIDGLAAALAQSGLDENDNSQTLVFLRQVARAIAQQGAAVVVIDHVAKDKDARGRWSRGAGAKLGEADVTLGLEVVEPYSRERAGSVNLWIAKDRHGALGPERSVAALMKVDPSDGGNSVSISFEPPPEAPSAGSWEGPTNAMAAVLEVLQEAGGQEFSANWIYNGLKARRKGFRRGTVLDAAEQLALTPSSGVLVRGGARNSRMFRFDPGAVEMPFAADDEEEF